MVSRQLGAKGLIPYRVKRKLRELIAESSLTYVFGAKKIDLGESEAAVTCLVKNGDYYLEAFIEHYSNYNFRHIFLLDNGSTDKTLEIAKAYKNVSVYTTRLPVNKYQAILKKVFAKTVVIGGWCLDVDIDEFFDYPRAYEISLEKFLTYLNSNNYSIVVTQMLDLFSSENMLSLTEYGRKFTAIDYKYFDIDCVFSEDYSKSKLVEKYGCGNIVSNLDLKLIYGGIRKKIYGIDCLLTKHSLFKINNKLELFPHNHFINNGVIADITCILRHYKLTGNCLMTSLQNKEAFDATGKGYSDLINFIMSNPQLTLKTERSQIIGEISDLAKSEFILLSERYTSV